ncbi:MAG TPA: hypothetical protein VHQ20_02300, partial [Patescibacteria group bacterium]|nr:hypothetical protein [Patescibacteria group bacterium]
LKSAWEQYKTHFNALVPITLIMGAGLYLQAILVFLNRGSSASFGMLYLVTTIIYFVGIIWAVPALLHRVNKLDQPMTTGEAFSSAKPYILPVFVAGLITVIFTVIGLILLIIPGIIIGVYLTFSVYVVVLENKHGMDAIKASKDYVKGHWFGVFGRLLLVGIIIAIVGGIIGWLGQMILGLNFGMLVRNIASLILAPFAVLAQFTLYKNLRALKGTVPSSAPAPVAPMQNI